MSDDQFFVGAPPQKPATSGGDQFFVGKPPSAAPESTMDVVKRVYDRLKSEIFVQPSERDSSLLKAAYLGILPSNIISEIGKQANASAEDIKSDIENPVSSMLADGMVGLKPALDVAGLITTPVTGTLSSVVGRPVEQMTGIRRGLVGDAASLVIPLGGEAKAAKIAGDVDKAFVSAADLARAERSAARAAASGKAPSSAKAAGESSLSDYEKAVKSLQGEGIDLTPGQISGGRLRRAEEAHKSNPFIGTAIRDAENKSIESFNKAAYNRALSPIGEKFDKSVKAGRDGIKYVRDKLNQSFDRMKPQLKFSPDDEFVNHIAEIRNSAGAMPEAQERQLEAIINQRIMRRIGPDGSFDGETFKQVESELGHLSRTYKSSGDAAQRELGNSIEDLNDALRQNLERSSSPDVRKALKDNNTAWALLTRLEDAASKRAESGGVFSTGDLAGAVRKMDRSARKSAYARGDAMLQDFTDTASKVIPNRLPDSGTAERQMWNNRGLLHQAVGTVTNPIAAKVMEAAVKPCAKEEIRAPLSATYRASVLQPSGSVFDNQSGSIQ